MIPSDFQVSKTRQYFPYEVDFIAINGGPILVGAGPLVINAPILPLECLIQGVTLWSTVTTILTAAANQIQSSLDGINWFTVTSVGAGVATGRAASAAAQFTCYGRFWRFNRTDAVGALTQCGIQLYCMP